MSADGRRFRPALESDRGCRDPLVAPHAAWLGAAGAGATRARRRTSLNARARAGGAADGGESFVGPRRAPQPRRPGPARRLPPGRMQLDADRAAGKRIGHAPRRAAADHAAQGPFRRQRRRARAGQCRMGGAGPRRLRLLLGRAAGLRLPGRRWRLPDPLSRSVRPGRLQYVDRGPLCPLCHDRNFDSENEGAIRALGYRPGTRNEQVENARPEDMAAF
jgi:hypothetical protein